MTIDRKSASAHCWLGVTLRGITLTEEEFERAVGEPK